MSQREIEKLIEETSNLIDAMLEVVAPDFDRITTKLKTITEPGLNAVMASAYSSVIKELQYYDTLLQKMQHIKAIHQIVIDGLQSRASRPIEVKSSGFNMIRLNHIQFQVACFEYLSSVNEIESNMRLLLETSGEKEYAFQYSNLLLSASRFINKNFNLLEGALSLSKEADLHNKVECVSAIYSMHSERSVLQAYLDKPLMSDGEIEPLQKSSSQAEIDLFE